MRLVSKLIIAVALTFGADPSAIGQVTDSITVPSPPPGTAQLWVDLDVTGNTATSVGSIQRCRRVVAEEGTFDVDLVLFNQTANFNSFEVAVAYDATAVMPIGVDVEYLLTSTGADIVGGYTYVEDLAGDAAEYRVGRIACFQPDCEEFSSFCENFPTGTGVLARLTFSVIDPEGQTGIDITGAIMYMDTGHFGNCFGTVDVTITTDVSRGQVVLDPSAPPDLGCWTCNTMEDLPDNSFAPNGVADGEPSPGLIKTSLRNAIREANGHTGPDHIGFRIDATKPVITVNHSADGTAFALPPLSDATGGTTIDGTTQANVSISGSAAPPGPGIKIMSASNTIDRLTINNFAPHEGVLIEGASASDNVVKGCRIGTNPGAGNLAMPNGAGVAMYDASDNIIGGDYLTTDRKRDLRQCARQRD